MELNLITIIIGLVTAGLVEAAKRLSWVPLNPKNLKAVRVLAAVLTFGGNTANAWANGDLTSAAFTNYLGVVAEGLVSYFTAYLGYKSLLKGKEKEDEFAG